MADGGNGLALPGGDRRHQRAGGAEEQTVDLFFTELPQQISAEHRRAAAAAGTARVDILPLEVVDENAAVAVVCAELHAVTPEQVGDDGAAERAEVAGDDQVIVLRPQAGVRKVGAQGRIGCGGKCQGCTIFF